MQFYYSVFWVVTDDHSEVLLSVKLNAGKRKTAKCTSLKKKKIIITIIKSVPVVQLLVSMFSIILYNMCNEK